VSRGFAKHALQPNPILGYVLSCHLWAEHLLQVAVRSVLKRPEALFNPRPPSFLQLVSLAEAHDIISVDFARVLRSVNSIRNKFAHRLSFEPSSQEIEEILRALREMKRPFHISFVPASERELMLALASITGHLERLMRQSLTKSRPSRQLKKSNSLKHNPLRPR
jgi:hypothetical protein